MNLQKWFEESDQNIQAIYCARNGHTYIYYNGQKLTKFAKQLYVDQVVELKDKTGSVHGYINMKRLIQFNKDVEKINWEYNSHQDVMHVWVHIKFDDGERKILHSTFNSIERFYSEEDLNLVAELMVAKYNLYEGG